jgi:hypothetical protein
MSLGGEPGNHELRGYFRQGVLGDTIRLLGHTSARYSSSARAKMRCSGEVLEMALGNGFLQVVQLCTEGANLITL